MVLKYQTWTKTRSRPEDHPRSEGVDKGIVVVAYWLKKERILPDWIMSRGECKKCRVRGTASSWRTFQFTDSHENFSTFRQQCRAHRVNSHVVLGLMNKSIITHLPWTLKWTPRESSEGGVLALCSMILKSFTTDTNERDATLQFCKDVCQ